jgi:hypothetical protein
MSASGVLEPAAPARPAPLELSEEDQEALLHLVAFIGGIGGVTPLYLDGNPNPACHLPARDLTPLEARVRRYAGRQVEMGLPEVHAGNGGPGECSALWVWVESRDQALRAGRRFKSLPSMVLRMGRSCRRLLLWWLSEPVAHVSIVAANKRIAYALHAPQKYAQPEKLRIPLPATCLTVDRKRPCPVLVTRMTDVTYARERIVGRLSDPPPDYMTRLRRGEIRR